MSVISERDKPLRIALLAHGMRVAGGLSVGKNLIAALGRVAPQHDYLITIPAGIGFEEICDQIPRCETIVYDRKGGLFRRWLFETFELRKCIAPFQPDVVFAAANKGLRNPPCPQALMVQDSHLFYPSKHFGRETFKSRVKVRHNNWHLERILPHTELVLCQTPVAERRLIQTYGYKGRTAVCPNAVSTLPCDENADSSVPQALVPYADRIKLLCLTRYYAHKNLESLLSLFQRFPEELATVVVVVNIPEDQNRHARRFLQSIEQLGLQDRVISVGFIPQRDLASYYRNCQALLLPTLLESFSGTYVEAMNYELPILTSDLDFAHVVCGDVALYFDPWDVRSIKDAILRLKANPDLGREMAARGKVRLQTMFKSWDEIAADLLEQLTKLARSH